MNSCTALSRLERRFLGLGGVGDDPVHHVGRHVPVVAGDAHPSDKPLVYREFAEDRTNFVVQRFGCHCSTRSFKTCFQNRPVRPSVPSVVSTSGHGAIQLAGLLCWRGANAVERSPRPARTPPPGCFRRADLSRPRHVAQVRSARTGLSIRRGCRRSPLARRRCRWAGLARVLQTDGQSPESAVKQGPIGNRQDGPCHGGPIAEPLNRGNNDLFRQQPAVRHAPARNRIATKTAAYRGQIALGQREPCADRGTQSIRPPDLGRPACPPLPRTGDGRRGVAGHEFQNPVPART